MTKMPTLFVSHGSPTILLEEDSGGRAFLSNLAADLPRPKAILMISAHWETEHPTVTAAENLETIHDFYGLPQALSEKTYPASGSPELAQRIANLIDGKLDDSRGLDHGAWIVLSFMYPQADIPVVQLSLQETHKPTYHYDLGNKLEKLREEGVLIIGSGAVTHNLKELNWHETTPDAWAQEFEDWFVHSIETNDHSQLLEASTAAPQFERSHPTPEHWSPLYLVMGAAQKDARLMHRGFEYKNLSMASARFD